jgi:hypothetical protein
MSWEILIAHAEGEEDLAEKLAGPIREEGYKVAHRGTIMVGESITEEASRLLSAGGPVVLCATIKAIGTGWANRLVSAARSNNPEVHIFPIQMEKDAYIQQLSLDGAFARYWQDPAKTMQDLIAALKKYFPVQKDKPTPLQIAEEQPSITKSYDLSNPVFFVPFDQKGDQVIGREKDIEKVRKQLTDGKRTGLGQAVALEGFGGLVLCNFSFWFSLSHSGDSASLALA